MADETMAGNKIFQRIAVGGELDIINRYVEEYRINGTDMISGMGVTTASETSPDIDIIGAGESPAGILLDYANVGDYKAGYSLGVTIANNKTAKVLRGTGGRIKVQCILDRSTTTAVALVKGDDLFWVDGGGVTSTAPADGVDLQMYMGELATAVTSGTADKVIEAWY